MSGNICFAVREEDVDSLVLFVEDFASFSGARRWFALE